MDHPQTANLATLSFAKLAEKSPGEISRLLHACQEQGFFYLGLTDSSVSQGIEGRLQALSLAKAWFDSPIEDKLKFHQDSVTRGYKPAGTLSGVVKGRQDGFENIKMPRDDFVKNIDILPNALGGENLHTFRQDLTTSHNITTTILSCLSDVLHPSTRFEELHHFERASQSTSMYFRYLKQSSSHEDETKGVGHNMHTDLGTLTLLYCEQWGLQVYNQTTATWEWVEPKKDHYVVNVGDALRFLSGKQLLSSLHRVVPYTGKEGEYRYSSAYFLRPDDDAQFMTSENTFVSAREWNDLKYDTFKAKHVDQAKNTVLTGGVVT